jgi:hypothetical protein
MIVDSYVSWEYFLWLTFVKKRKKQLPFQSQKSIHWFPKCASFLIDLRLMLPATYNGSKVSALHLLTEKAGSKL